MKSERSFKKINFEKFLFIAGILSSIHYLYDRDQYNFFWDLNIYQNAINMFNQGSSAYIDYSGFYFVYPPFILFIFSMLGEYLTIIFLLSYLFILIFFLKQQLGRQIFYFSMISSPIFFNNLFFACISGGNITIFLHLIILTIYASNLNYKYYYFIIAVVLISIIKPYLLSYLILLFLMEDNYKINFKYFLIGCLSFICIFCSQYFLFPELFRDFTQALFTQAIGNAKDAGVDIGLAPYSIFGYFLSKTTAISLHFLIIILFAFVIINIASKAISHLKANEKKNLIIFLFLILIIFLNPRMKSYDWWLQIAASTGIIIIFIKNIKFNYKLNISLFSIILVLIFIALLFREIHIVKYLKVYTPPFLSFYLMGIFVFQNKINENFKLE